jgi:hypothetical protein
MLNPYWIIAMQNVRKRTLEKNTANGILISYCSNDMRGYNISKNFIPIRNNRYAKRTEIANTISKEIYFVINNFFLLYGAVRNILSPSDCFSIRKY